MDVTAHNAFTRNQGLEGTCSPDDSYLLPLKPEEMVHFFPQKSSMIEENTTDGSLQAKQDGKGGKEGQKSLRQGPPRL